MAYRHARAARYAEEHGIVDYVVQGSRLIYYANYPAYLAEPRRSYKVTVNLCTGKEEAREQTRWNRKGNHNMYR